MGSRVKINHFLSNKISRKGEKALSYKREFDTAFDFSKVNSFPNMLYVDEYYEIIVKLLYDYVYAPTEEGLAQIVLILSERIYRYGSENGIHIYIVDLCYKEYVKMLKNDIKRNTVKFLSVLFFKKEKRINVFFKKYTRLMFRVIVSLDNLFINHYINRYTDEYNYDKNLDREFVLDNKELPSIQAILDNKTLMENFGPLKELLKEKLEKKTFKNYLFVYYYLFSFHWRLKKEKEFVSNDKILYKHFPEFIEIEHLFMKSPEIKYEYMTFEKIANNLMYGGYEDFCKDLLCSVEKSVI
jgi:hypothetical protein